MDFKDRLRMRLKALNMSQADLHRKSGLGRSSINHWYNGNAIAHDQNLFILAESLECNSDWLLTGKGFIYNSDINPPSSIKEESAEYIADIEPWDEETKLDDDRVLIPFYSEIELSAGNGRIEDIPKPFKKLPFSRSTLRKMGVPISAACAFKASGNSQFPMIRDGNTVGVDKSKTDIKDGEMYAISHDGMTRLKVLYRLPGGKIRLYSYNTQEYPEEIIQGEELKTIKIIGRVFWYSGLL